MKLSGSFMGMLVFGVVITIGVLRGIVGISSGDAMVIGAISRGRPPAEISIFISIGGPGFFESG